MSKGWDNSMLKKLKALTGKGLSTSEIGKRLGMSKNAIVGKLNRLGWNAKAGGAVAEPKEKAKESKKSATTPKTTTVKKTTTSKKTVAGTKQSATAVKKETVKKESAKKESGKTVAKKEANNKTAEKKSESKTSSSSAKTLAMHQRIVQHSLEMASLKPNQCRWPIGDPDSEHFHFCGETVFVGKPYCYEHCKQAYQFTPPKKK